MKQSLHLSAFSHCCGCPHTAHCPHTKPHSPESTEDTADSNAASQACPFSHFNLSRGISGLCNLLPKENSHAVQYNTTLLIASRLHKPPCWGAWICLEMSRPSNLPPPPGGAGTARREAQTAPRLSGGMGPVEAFQCC